MANHTAEDSIDDDPRAHGARRWNERRSKSRWGRFLLVVSAFACLAWVVLRSGRRPDRLRYPCQQAALASCYWLLPAAGVGIARLVRSRRVRLAVTVPLLAAMVFFMVAGMGGEYPAGAFETSEINMGAARLRAATLVPETWSGAAADGAHDIFLVNNVPVPDGGPRHSGVDALVHLMAEGGVHLYRSDSDAFCASPGGIVAPDDVVLIKVNCAYDQRGTTNSDVVKGLITSILEHPDGFSGEVVVVENCEGGPDFDLTYNNAENINQNYYAVVGSFGDPSRVSCSSWWSFTDTRVGEYDTGDTGDGYVWVGDNVSYPKFTTGRGTKVSLARGIWDGSYYDKSRLRLINVPVLKSHNSTGVTACLKHFMGVPSIHMTTDVHNDLVFHGFMGRMMNQVIYPDLNILDAIWVSPSHPQGPAAPYSLAVRTNLLMAGLDPVAIDYYASKHVLYPVSGYERHNPDTPYGEYTNPYHDGTKNAGYPYDALRIMLDITAGVLWQGGHDVTCDPSLMNVRARDLADGLGWSGGHCVGGAGEPSATWHFAEGTTREGFDEWICVGNPNPRPAAVEVEFMNGEGELFPCEFELPGSSRATMHANSVVGPGEDISCTVSSNLPVVAERPMYFDYAGTIRGGHDVTGATSAEKTWYFAEGYTGSGFDQYVCVLNPGNTGAALTFRFQTREEGEVVKTGQTVGPRSRATFKVNDMLGPDCQNSLELESDVPVIAERTVYFDYLGTAERHWKGGHCVMGATGLSKECFLAEGTTRDGFEEWLTLQNPNDGPLRVEADYLPGGGQGTPVKRVYTLQPGTRHTVFVADEVGPDRDVSVKLRSDSSFLAERPMYFRYSGYGASWPGGHCVMGINGVSEDLYFAEGYTGEGFQEWLCLQNPSDSSATVRIDYFASGQGSLPPRSVGVPAGSRVTVNVNENAGTNLQVSCRVRTVSGDGIVAERPMYFDYR